MIPILRIFFLGTEDFRLIHFEKNATDNKNASTVFKSKVLKRCFLLLLNEPWLDDDIDACKLMFVLSTRFFSLTTKAKDRDLDFNSLVALTSVTVGLTVHTHNMNTLSDKSMSVVMSY